MNPITKRHRRLFAMLYFTFGLGIMSWVPRFSEVKQNLGLSKKTQQLVTDIILIQVF